MKIGPEIGVECARNFFALRMSRGYGIFSPLNGDGSIR
jgi:hypothetical protein